MVAFSPEERRRRSRQARVGAGRHAKQICAQRVAGVQILHAAKVQDSGAKQRVGAAGECHSLRQPGLRFRFDLQRRRRQRQRHRFGADLDVQLIFADVQAVPIGQQHLMASPQRPVVDQTGIAADIMEVITCIMESDVGMNAGNIFAGIVKHQIIAGRAPDGAAQLIEALEYRLRQSFLAIHVNAQRNGHRVSAGGSGNQGWPESWAPTAHCDTRTGAS